MSERIALRDQIMDAAYRLKQLGYDDSEIYRYVEEGINAYDDHLAELADVMRMEREKMERRTENGR